MEIKKPHFYRNLINGDRVSENVITEEDFDQWFNEMLADSTKVYTGPSYNGHWIDVETMHTTETALLINITEIKKETPAKEEL